MENFFKQYCNQAVLRFWEPLKIIDWNNPKVFDHPFSCFYLELEFIVYVLLFSCNACQALGSSLLMFILYVCVKYCTMV